MTSVQTKKGGKGTTERERQTILKEMKVRTKLKTDMSWINQGSEDDKDEVTSPISPQLKALEGRKLLWSPTPESESNRNSGIFTAKEIITSSSSPPVQSINSRFSYTSNETNTTPSISSKTSPPPSTTGNKQFHRFSISDILLHGPDTPVSVVSWYSVLPLQYAWYPVLQVYRFSTPDILVPIHCSNLVGPTTSYIIRTEQASSVLRNTTTKDRSYVISAAKRNSGVVTHDSPSPFVAKRVEIQDEETGTNRKSQTLPKTLSSFLADDANRVEIQDEETGTNRKSQTLPKTLSSFLADDANRYENNWTETQPKQTPPQPSQPRVTERSSSPRMTSYSMTSSADGRSSPLKPETGKITVVRDESRNESKDVSKPPTEKESSTTVQTTRTQRVTERSSSPRLTSYSMSSSIDGRSSPVKPEAGRVTVVRDGGVEVKDKKDESPPKSLDSYLYEDASRFENKWKTNQTIQPTSQTSPARVSDRPESPKLSSWNTQTKTSTINPEPGKITVLRQESEKTTPKPTENRATTRTVTTTVESGNINPDMPKLTSYSDITETKSSSIQAGPGKITVLREESNKEPPKVTTQVTTTTRTVDPKVESNKDSPDIPKLTSSSISRTLTENPTPIMQVGPGKITIIREDSTPPKPVPRTETKLKDTSSDKKSDLISWTDLDNRSDNRFPKEKPATAPTPVARNINKASEKPANEAPLIVISPEFDEKRPAQPSRTESISTETRYRVSESLDDSQPIPSSNR
ncbi:PREDICTED: mucin-2-like [Nanorana parkeri]|uniref:mucin-2-like n=1 Tax=Nanorana parkeri TaxID=125878 RepID=UPI0008547553|nr:PREDICTED: mucin-2-like [Nanorana parkeri]